MIKTHTNPELLNDLRKLCKGVKEISSWLESKNWTVIDIIESCITGTKGNREYFIYSVRKNI